jgi:acetyltransferase-like isoleucine patch superfamily enzyme
VSITCKESIRIGDRTQIGNNVVMVDHDHTNHRKWDEYKTEPIVIGNNVWIGANSVILRGSKIGDNSIIGAGCIIKGEIPENSKVMQNRQIVILKKC